MEGISENNAPDFIIGHHICVTKEGVEEFHKANDFADTWRMMREGAYSLKWLSRVPCHQATLTRTALLRENAYDLSWQIAADHEFMYRMRVKGARFHHCDTTLAICFGGGFSSHHKALCHEGWWRLACVCGDKGKADHWFGRELKGAAGSDAWWALPRKIAAGILATVRSVARGVRKGVS
jgi:hypothetical protein